MTNAIDELKTRIEVLEDEIHVFHQRKIINENTQYNRLCSDIDRIKKVLEISTRNKSNLKNKEDNKEWEF